MSNFYRFVSAYYDQVKAYFPIDSLLLNIFSFVTPSHEFEELCKEVPAHISAKVLLTRALLPVESEVSCNN